MIQKLINTLLIPFKVKYEKVDKVNLIDFGNGTGIVLPKHYRLYFNIGTILKPKWFDGIPNSFKNKKELMQVLSKKKVYYNLFLKDRPNHNTNYNTVDFHEQLMK